MQPMGHWYIVVNKAGICAEQPYLMKIHAHVASAELSSDTSIVLELLPVLT